MGKHKDLRSVLTQKDGGRQNIYMLHRLKFCRRMLTDALYYNEYHAGISRVLPNFRTTSLRPLSYCIIIGICCLICQTNSTVTGAGTINTKREISTSLLEYDQILLTQSNLEHEEVSSFAASTEAEHNCVGESNPYCAITMDGFNLLWLIASKLRYGDKEAGRIGHNASSRVTGPDSVSYAKEVYLDSTWPRRFLRYSRKLSPEFKLFSRNPDSSIVVPPSVASHLSSLVDFHSLSNVKLSDPTRMTPTTSPNLPKSVGNSIGFEMEFRMERFSGSGYIITGRSLNGQPFVATASKSRNFNISTEQQSWFGLFAHVRTASYNLRLEYKNVAWHRGKQLQIRFSENFRKSDWQSLAVNIDFDANTIKYWVNCSARPTVQVRANISHPSSFYSVYRLLQHKRREALPVKVTFRTVIVTEGKRRNTPRHCEHVDGRDRVIPKCSGGKTYMSCGPSCQRTCGGTHTSGGNDDELRSCAIACVAGCHCPAGLVTYGNHCIRPEQCPCFIGSDTHTVGSKVTINNEICTCIEGRWSCYALPRFTHMPRNLTLNKGRTSQLTCAVLGNPLPAITWNGPSKASFYVVEKNGGRISVLVLRNVTGNEDGLYSCVAEIPSEWKAVATCRVRVLSRPVITLPRMIPVTRGYPVLAIDCIVSGLPQPRIRWRRNGGALTSNDHISIYLLRPGVLRLKILQVQSLDAGEWECLAYNAAGYSKRAVRILVRLPEPNSMAFYRKPVDQIVKRGRTAIFNCQILDHHWSGMNVTWVKDGALLEITGKRLVIRRHQLLVRQVNARDAGTYTCIVTVRKGGRELRAGAELMVKGKMFPWSEWSACSVTCGTGLMFKRRHCSGNPVNKKTCHGKLLHVKRCNSQLCPGVCSVVGDPHYTTFDGRKFNFHGDCGYVLAHDASGNEFKVILNNAVCGRRLSCLDSASVILSIPGYAAVVDIKRDGSVTVNSIPIRFPYVSQSGSSVTIDKIGLFIVLNAGPDFELKWALPHRLYLVVSSKYAGRTRGFCGNYNGDVSDDNIIPSGRSVTSDLEFGQSWTVLEGTVNFSCSAFRPLMQPCERDRLLQETARGACRFLLNKEIFGPCHSAVDPHPYIDSCMFDICSTSIKRTNTYFCVALSAYAEECIREKVVLNWRTKDICGERCYSGKVYMECGPRCTRYCPGIVNEKGEVCSSDGHCISGCHCSAGTLLHEGRCVDPAFCPCVDKGITFKNGTNHFRNCEKCFCDNGKWRCSFNKNLCEYSSAILRGPISQVLPLEYSVSFCCEAIGIPKPTIEWFLNGRKINTKMPRTARHVEYRVSEHPITEESVYGRAKTNLRIYNVSSRHAGVYSCKAINSLGSQMSEPSILTVIADSWTVTCDARPKRRIFHLPEGCFVATANGIKEHRIDVGQCLGKPCFYNPRIERHPNRATQGSCGRTRQCCQPSVTTPVTVNCSDSMYVTSFVATVVRECGCAICGERVTVVEGVLKTAITGFTIKHAKIIHRGRVVAYTSNTGSFRIAFSFLPDETRHVTLTFVDIIFKRFPATVKNLPVIVGDVTIHSVSINGRSDRARFNASSGLRYMFRNEKKRGRERLRLIIPPSSLVSPRGSFPFAGQVLAVFNIVMREYGSELRRLHTVPGGFVGINRKGQKRLMSPSYILSVSLYDRYGRTVELYPGKSVILLVNAAGFREQMQPWILDELTGFWRERETRIDVEPFYNKKGDRMLLLSAKLPRVNTAWALSSGEEPCYIRAKVLDSSNDTVPGVRVAMATTGQLPVTSYDDNSSSSPGFNAFVEDLTRLSDTPGMCLPVGCMKLGVLYASQQGNELSLLQPDVPPPYMGRVANRSASTFQQGQMDFRPTFDHAEVISVSFIGQQRQPPTFSYYRREEDCKRIGNGDQHTFIFRDNSWRDDVGGNIAESRGSYNQVIQTMILAEDAQRRDKNGRSMRNTFCHIKVGVVWSRATPRRPSGMPMVLEAFTFSANKSSSEMRMVGWRRRTFETPKRLAPRRSGRWRGRNGEGGKASEELCIEYLCGDEYNRDEIVRISVVAATDNAADGRESIRPKCTFLSNHKVRSSQIRTSRRNRSGGTCGSYAMVHPVETEETSAPTGESGGGQSRWPFLTKIGSAFKGRSFVESKNKCSASKDDRTVSAWVQCI